MTMKHIPQNSITSITASYEDGNFPAENMLDDHPGRIWSAGGLVRNADLYLYVSGGFSDLAFFNTNARQVTFSAADPSEISWGGSDTWGLDSWGNVPVTATGTVEVLDKSNALWISLTTAITVPCLVSVNLTSPGSETLYAGICTGGIAEDYGGCSIRYGAQRSRKDNSIESYNPLGYRYYRKTSLPKILPVTARMEISEYNKLDAYIEENGRIPSAWNLVEGYDGWLIFGYPDASSTFDYLDHVNLSLTINEVI
jgi:hypothetical protein